LNTILVTGGAGFIGKHFVSNLIKKNVYDKIIVYDKLTYASDLNYIKSLKSKKITFVQGDIADEEKLENLFNNNTIRTVINFAAESHVDRSIENSQSFFKSNVLGLQNLLDVSRRHFKSNSFFLQISTDEVYGGCLSLDDALNHEESPLNPKNPYAASKASGDLLIKSYEHTYDFPSIILRLTNNYGLFQNEEKLIPKVISRILNQEDIGLYGDGMYYRNWLYVEDACEGIFRLLESKEKHEIYNLVGNGLVSNLELVNEIIDIFKRHSFIYKGRIKYIENRQGHDYAYLVDGSKVSAIFKQRQRTLQEGLSVLVEQALNN
jgi:dTDP-glucose 4,6-dehydratase